MALSGHVLGNARLHPRLSGLRVNQRQACSSHSRGLPASTSTRRKRRGRGSTPSYILRCRIPTAAIPRASSSMRARGIHLVRSRERRARVRRPCHRAQDGPAKTNVFHVFMSHLHWDHIMGFPFFAPAYMPGNRIRIYGCHEALEHAFRRQQAPPSSRSFLAARGAGSSSCTLEPGRAHEIAGSSVTPKLQMPFRRLYGYRFERGGKDRRLLTDSEHKLDDSRRDARSSSSSARPTS